MDPASYRYLFGPVRSRRMGLSLGIDLVPFKTCSFDCPYCQVGRTTCHTLERRDYVPVVEVLAEFDRWAAAGGRADILTLAGSGEPTLHAGFGDVLTGLAERVPTRRALLSNGSLFSLPEVRAAACRANVVKGTLSAWDDASFTRIHRPHPGLRFGTFVSGFRALREQFRGEFWVEVFLLKGINDRPADVRRIAALVSDIRPDSIHLNTVVRPPADGDAAATDAARLGELASLFTPVAEVVASFPGHAVPGPAGESAGAWREADVIDMIRRHPCTAADVAALLGLSEPVVAAHLQRMAEAGLLRRERRSEGTFFAPVT